MKNTDTSVQTFIAKCSEKNGTYLYEGGANEKYLFLNGYHVGYGAKAPYFTDVKMEVENGALNIHFDEQYTYDYKNKEIDNRVLYIIKQPNDTDTIHIYKNGQETYFDMVSN
jgi:hypothetical protein